MTPQIDPKLKDAYGRVVVAGMKALYAPQTRQMLMDSLKGDAPIPQKVANTVAGLLKMLDMKAGMKIPKQVLIPVGITLLMDLFKLLAQAGVEFEPDDVSEASGLLVQTLVSEYKMMQQMQGQQALAQPQPAAPAPAGMIGGV